MFHRDIQLYCPTLRAYHSGTWDLVTIFVDDLPHYIKKIKQTSYILIDDDVINMQTSLKIHIQLYPASAMACCSKTLVLWALSYWWWLIIMNSFKKKNVYSLYNDGVIIVPDMLHRDIQLYCPRRRAYHCGIWYLVTIYVDNLPHYTKNTK